MTLTQYFILKNLVFSLIKRYNPHKVKFITTAVSFVDFVDFVRDKWSFFEKPEDKIGKYWGDTQSRQEVIEEADVLFEEERYMDVYESLNRIIYSKDIEVVWRLARAIYNLSLTPDIKQEVRKEMMEEAYEILQASQTIGKDKANYYKWRAVIINTRNSLENLETQVREYPIVRDHLMKACELNPKDFTVQFMLGRWYYEMANLTWFQRKIAKFLFKEEPPTSNFYQAYKHLIKAEELNPRAYFPNIYLLGCVCIQLGQYYRAKYYLNMALGLPMHNECDSCCVNSAKCLLRKLEKYDLGKDLLYENYQYGFEQ